MSFLKKGLKSASKALGGGSKDYGGGAGPVGPGGDYHGRTFLHGHLEIEVISGKLKMMNVQRGND